MIVKLGDKMLTLAKVFGLVDCRAISLKEAVTLSGYSYWHLTRLYHRYQESGLKELFQQHRNRPPTKISPQQVSQLRNYYIDLGKPQLSLLLYFFRLKHPDLPSLSREWARQILIHEQVYSPGKRGKVFRHRFEAPAPGLLVQGDSTTMQWLPNDTCYYHLIAFIDDCTRLCLGARIAAHDSVVEHFQILKGVVRRYGRFVALYYDNDEKYRYIRHNQSRHYTYHTDQADLQVVRALSELGIKVINTKLYDPCGKGKIERFIQTVQLQLPVWFRRYGVQTLSEANRVLSRYIRFYNQIRYHRELRSTPQEKFQALGAQSRFTPVDSKVDLNKVFSYRVERIVDRANTIRFNGIEYQLQPTAGGFTYCGKKAEVRYLPGEPVRIYIDGQQQNYHKLLTKTKDAVE
ncbi:MAG: integrase core domain-containing protein [candidate division WOR-3 bacterium]